MILKNRYFLVIVALLVGSFIGFKLTETFAIKYIMENCIKLEVPSNADYKIKDNWGDAK